MNATLLMPPLTKIPFRIKGKTEYIYTDISKKLLPLKLKGENIGLIAEEIKNINPESIVMTETQYNNFTSKIQKLCK